jgi:hypothetical protein
VALKEINHYILDPETTQRVDDDLRIHHGLELLPEEIAKTVSAIDATAKVKSYIHIFAARELKERARRLPQ